MLIDFEVYWHILGKNQSIFWKGNNDAREGQFGFIFLDFISCVFFGCRGFGIWGVST
jgi:hypothetical protein